MTRNRSLLIPGLGLTLRRFPAFLWAFAFNFLFSALTTARIAGSVGAVTNSSLAAQPLHYGFDLPTLASLAYKLSQGPGLSPSFATSIALYLATYFLLVPGTLLCYQTGAPARLSTLLSAGLLHFWRFVRITLLTALAFAIILGPLAALQSRWADHVNDQAVGRHAFFAELAGVLLIALVATILRLYFDLVEVYTVQLGLQLRASGKPDRRVRKTLAPAFRALRYNFSHAYGTFLLLFLLGFSAVILTARIAMHSLAQPRVWPMFLLAQLGLFLLLFTRFWQRGAETVLSLEDPLLEHPVVRTSYAPRVPSPAPAPLTPTPAPPTPPVIFEQHLAPTPSAAAGSPLAPADPFLTLPLHPYMTDPIPNPEPHTPSLTDPDPGIYHPDQQPGREPEDR